MRTGSVLPFLLIALLPFGLYFALFHPATLDPTNIGWLIAGTDNGENALGLHAFLNDPNASWWPRTTLLNAPDGVTLLFTDSNPLVALIARPFAGWLPADLQLVGPWVLLCFALHTLFAWALLREHAPGFVALWCGVALFLLLPTLANRFVHVNLLAHWLILWSLWLFLDPRRAGDLRWWAAVLIVAAMVHNYLLLMVAAIWASALLERFFAAGSVKRRAGLVLGSAVLLAAVGAIAWAHGAGGDFEPTGSYGFFSMSIDSLWNPGNPSYSAFLPAIEQRQGRGFEGFQYLGLGILFLIPIALAAWIARRREPSDLARLAWLAPALVVLTLLAISSAGDFAGVPLFDLDEPAWLAGPLDMVRASGRLFWPVAYVMLLLAVRIIFRLSRERAVLVLAAALTFQLLDLGGMFQAIRAKSDTAAQRTLYRKTPSPQWDRAIAAARDVTFAPPDAIPQLALFQEIAWRAVNAGKPVRIVYAARVSIATRDRLRAEDLAFSRGNLDPHRLYVLLPGMPVPDGAAGRYTSIDGIAVLLPVGAR